MFESRFGNIHSFYILRYTVRNTNNKIFLGENYVYSYTHKKCDIKNRNIELNIKVKLRYTVSV